MAMAIIYVQKEEVFAMLRDRVEETADGRIIMNMGISDLNKETIKAYRKYPRLIKANPRLEQTQR